MIGIASKLVINPKPKYVKCIKKNPQKKGGTFLNSTTDPT
jgi:hypothetical protein